jgi:hypothetical protein
MKAQTKKAKEEEVRRMVATLVMDVHYDDGTDVHAYFLELLQGHHAGVEKLGCGAEYFVKGLNEYRKESMYLMRHGESELTRFSWVKCVTGLPSTPLSIRTRLMRELIRPDIFEFKRSVASLACVMCASVDQPQVDHCTKPFQVIRDEYLAQREFSEDGWVEHHRANADYQVLCAPCNVRKGNGHFEPKRVLCL